MRKVTSLLLMMALLLAAIPAFAQEESSDEAGENVWVRVAHFSPDAPAVDIYLNGESAIPGLAYEQISDWTELPAGTFDIAVVPSGTEEEPTTVENAVLTLEGVEIAAEENQRLTFVAAGSVEAGTLAVYPIVEDYSAIAEEQARVTVFHGIEGAPSVDVLAGDTAIVTFLSFPGTDGNNDGVATVDVPAGLVNLSVVLSGTDTEVVRASNVVLFENTNYLFAAIGTPEEPLLFASSTEMPVEEEMMEEGEAMTGGTIADIAAGDENFSTLVTAIGVADPAVAELLSGEGEYTVFAPTNDAFATLPEETLNAALADSALLTTILQYHVVEGALFAEDILAVLEGQESIEVETLAGLPLTVTLEGDTVLINGIEVTATDIAADNGVIHVIAGVLVPPSEGAEGEGEAMMGGTIADIAAGDENFSTLLTAISMADPAVAELLSGEGEYTVFAPTNDAFGTLPEETLNAALADSALLTTILQYHVVEGALFSEDILAALEGQESIEVETLAGLPLTVTLEGDTVLVNGIEVTTTDIAADNGVIHVISGVLVPPTE